MQRVHTITVDKETFKEIKHESYDSGVRSTKIEAYDIIRYAFGDNQKPEKAKQLIFDLYDGDQEAIDNLLKWLELN